MSKEVRLLALAAVLSDKATPEEACAIMAHVPQEKKFWWPTFLATLSMTGSVTEACEAAGISCRTAYDWREKSPEFKAAWQLAADALRDRIKAAAVARAIDGWDEPVIWQGAATGATVRRYSDRLLVELHKTHCAPKNSENQGGTTVNITILDAIQKVYASQAPPATDPSPAAIDVATVPADAVADAAPPQLPAQAASS